MKGMRRAPLSCFLCCVACQPEWICPIPGISQRMWLECYLLPSGMPGSWFHLGFLERPRVSTQSAFSHNATGRRSLKRNGKLSLNNESRHTCRRYFSYTAMLSWFANLSQIRSIFPTHQINHSKSLEKIYIKNTSRNKALQFSIVLKAFSLQRGRGRWSCASRLIHLCIVPMLQR